MKCTALLEIYTENQDLVVTAPVLLKYIHGLPLYTHFFACEPSCRSPALEGFRYHSSHGKDYAYSLVALSQLMSLGTTALVCSWFLLLWPKINYSEFIFQKICLEVYLHLHLIVAKNWSLQSKILNLYSLFSLYIYTHTHASSWPEELDEYTRLK